MRLKKCVKCGQLFAATRSEQRICDECLSAGRSTTLRPRTCQVCGATFDGGPSARYCPDCRAVRGKERAKKYRQNGPSRPLGSIDHCIVCGKEYVVNSGNQHYCPDCAEEAVRQLDRVASKKWNAKNNYYTRRSQEGRNVQKICVICGGPVPPGTNRITCSPECDKLRAKRNRDDVDLRRGLRKSPTTVSRLDDDLLPTAKRVERIAAACKAYHAEYYAKNKKQIKTQQAEYYARNKEQIRAYQAEYYAKNKERIKAQQAEYYAKNKERIKAQKAGRITADCKAHRAEYVAENKERIKAYQAEYYRKNKDRIAAQRKEKREQKKQKESTD